MAKMRVLELRIHGIANSPPTEMLSAQQELVERREGDDEGSFWRIKPTSQDTSTPGVPGVQIVTEAYSWGKQTRSGGAALAVIGRSIVHIGWLLVLPFGLCNVAYWARRDIKGTDEDTTLWAGGAGAIPVRIFALLQTLFYTVGLLTVFVQLIALQCYKTDRQRGSVSCAALPAWLDFVAGWTPDARAAVFSVVPILILLFIYVIGIRARKTFHLEKSFDPVLPQKKNNSSPSKRNNRTSSSNPTPDEAPPQPALLATRGFWRRVRVTNTSARAHLSGAIALTVVLLAWDALRNSNPNADLPQVLRAFVLGQADNPVASLVLVVGIVLLVGVVVVTAAARLTEEIWSTDSKRAWSAALLALSIAVYAFWVVWTFTTRNSDPGPRGDGIFQGLIVAPTVIAAGAALIAVGSLSWGYPRRQVIVPWILLLAFGAAITAILVPPDERGTPGLQASASIVALTLVALAVGIGVFGHRKPEVKLARRLAGWWGNGAAVALLLALFSSLVITSLFVLGTYAWLTAETEAPDVADGWRDINPGALPETARSAETDPLKIEPPEFHQRFAVMLMLVLCVLVAVTVLAVITALWHSRALSLPGPKIPQMDGDQVVEDDERLGGVGALLRRGHSPSTRMTDSKKPAAVPTSDYPPLEEGTSARLRAVADARQYAGLAHRGEPVLGWLATLTALALVPIAIPYFDVLLREVPSYESLSESDVPVAVLGLLALAVVARVVTNAVTSAERPLGLVWDVIGFFPRAGHPFAPPCYAERAVAEVVKRMREWIKEEGEDAQVILSAHSMGATIAVGAIMSLHAEEDEDTLARVALLTHGVQLRPYFSRFFPEVFGPRILGIRGTRGPALLGADPWKKQVLDDYRHPSDAQDDRDPPTVVELLGGNLRHPDRLVAPRWRSLWRRTDPLGFPVNGYWRNDEDGHNVNPIDTGATEREPRSYLWSVAGHSDYLSTRQYREARDELIDMLKQNRRSRRLRAAASIIRHPFPQRPPR